MAYRQTYYNLYSSGDFNIFSPIRQAPKDKLNPMTSPNAKFDLAVYPDDYRFSDLNLKYTHNFDNGDQFYVSMYSGGDYFHLSANADITRQITGLPGETGSTPLSLSMLDKEDNRQDGLSAFLSKNGRAICRLNLFFRIPIFKKNN